jgi:hypothetical protein
VRRIFHFFFDPFPFVENPPPTFDDLEPLPSLSIEETLSIEESDELRVSYALPGSLALQHEVVLRKGVTFQLSKELERTGLFLISPRPDCQVRPSHVYTEFDMTSSNCGQVLNNAFYSRRVSSVSTASVEDDIGGSDASFHLSCCSNCDPDLLCIDPQTITREPSSGYNYTLVKVISRRPRSNLSWSSLRLKRGVKARYLQTLQLAAIEYSEQVGRSEYLSSGFMSSSLAKFIWEILPSSTTELESHCGLETDFAQFLNSKLLTLHKSIIDKIEK